MPRGELDRLEVTAGDLVSLLIGGRAVATDVPGAPDGTVDFIIEDLAHGRTAALEITSAADSAVVSQIQAAFGRQWSSPDLTHNWMVGLHAREPSDNIRALMDQVTPRVVSVERIGETSVELHHNDPRYMPRPVDAGDDETGVWDDRFRLRRPARLDIASATIRSSAGPSSSPSAGLSSEA